MMFRRSTEVVVGYDCMFTECQHTPKGEHGIRGNQILHRLHTELPDGRQVAIELALGTNVYPDTVPDYWAQPREAPRGRGVAVHVQTLASAAPNCAVLKLHCDVVYDSALASNQFYEVLGLGEPYERPRRVHTPELYQSVLHPGDKFWDALQAFFVERLSDPVLFQQNDETETMADIRTRYDQALAAHAAAGTALGAATKEFNDAVSKYEARDPGYRRT